MSLIDQALKANEKFANLWAGIGIEPVASVTVIRDFAYSLSAACEINVHTPKSLQKLCLTSVGGASVGSVNHQRFGD